MFSRPVRSPLLANLRCFQKLPKCTPPLRWCAAAPTQSNEKGPKKVISDLKTPLIEKSIRRCPQSIQPYLRLMRMERPVGTWLTLLPGLWSLSMAVPAGSLPDADLIVLFCIGGFLMRGFGCTVNDMWDKNIDEQVERTKSRPLASGALSRWDALWFASGQLGCAGLVLLQLNWYSVVLGVSSVGLAVIYPLMKRFTYWPQAFLGVVFNWGGPLGFAAVQGLAMNWPAALSLYGAAISWTLIYDTIYAHQDKRDDLKVGTKSTALRFQSATPAWLCAFASSMTLGLVGAGVAADQSWPFFLSVAISSGLLAKQIYTLKIDDPQDCAEKFVANKKIGLFILAGCIGSNIVCL